VGRFHYLKNPLPTVDRHEVSHQLSRHCQRCAIGVAFLFFLVIEHGQPAEAVKYVRAALVANPNYKEALYELGQAEIALGQPKEAVAPLRKLISLDAEYYKAHFVLGTVLRQLG
jgi:tetratricopeptide (TPR) repeat protein